MTEFQLLLKQEREKRNLSIRKASELIGISHTYLTALEKGIDTRGLPTTKPTPEILKLISKGYNLDYNYLMELCNYINNDESTELFSSNPDIKMIARAGKKMTPEQIEQLRKYAEYMFPEAFNE